MRETHTTAEEVGLTENDIKELGAVYTPPELVQKMIDELNIDWNNIPEDKIFLDPTCGSGNFLVQLAKKGIQLKNIYGVDIVPENIKVTKDRLKEIYKDVLTEEEIDFHLNRNIILADALTYHYQFWWYKEQDISKDDW